MTIPRILVLLSAFAAILCAGATAASVQADLLAWLFTSGAIISGIAFALVTIPVGRVSRFRRRRNRVARPKTKSKKKETPA